jgi:hypothetical protein
MVPGTLLRRTGSAAVMGPEARTSSSVIIVSHLICDFLVLFEPSL